MILPNHPIYINLFLLISFALTSCQPVMYRHATSPLATPLPKVAPESVGLRWQECLLSPAAYQDSPNREQVGRCFGHSLEPWSAAERANFGSKPDGDLENWKLAIGRDLYTTTSQWSAMTRYTTYTLYRNQAPVKSVQALFDAYSPNLWLANVAGKAAWELADRAMATIIYDGVDLRDQYGLEKAYRPYALANKLIFIGQDAQQFFVVYAGQQIDPPFDKIWFAYCCEGVLYSVAFGEGKYIFRGERDGKYYLVEITALLH